MHMSSFLIRYYYYLDDVASVSGHQSQPPLLPPPIPKLTSSTSDPKWSVNSPTSRALFTDWKTRAEEN